MKKEQFYQKLDTVCRWILLLEKPAPKSPVKKMTPDPNGWPIITELLVKPMVCKICAVVTETDQLINIRRNIPNSQWVLTCKKCRKSFAKTPEGYQETTRPRKTPESKESQ